MKDKIDFDLVVVGAGIVGLTSALLLAKKVANIAIIEAKEFNNNFDNSTYDLRCSAINLNSEQIFKNLNIWQDVVAARYGLYEKMFIWDKSSIEFNAQDIASKHLGSIVENRVILKALWQQVIKHNNISVYCPNTIKDIEVNDLSCNIELDDNKKISSKLIIAADGANSSLRNYFNIETKAWDCKQTAIVATVKTAQKHQNTAWQRFTLEGPIAFLPLDNPYTSTIVWTSGTEESSRLMALDEHDFNQALTKVFANKLGQAAVISKRFAVPLVMRHAQNYVLPRVALVGDAAHVVHPLAGQGLNLGLADAQALANIITVATDKHRDIGLLHTLKKYQRSRRGNNLRMLIAMDLFKKTFCSSNEKISILRNFGLKAINNQKWLKRYIVGYAQG